MIPYCVCVHVTRPRPLRVGLGPQNVNRVIRVSLTGAGDKTLQGSISTDVFVEIRTPKAVIWTPWHVLWIRRTKLFAGALIWESRWPDSSNDHTKSHTCTFTATQYKLTLLSVLFRTDSFPTHEKAKIEISPNKNDFELRQVSSACQYVFMKKNWCWFRTTRTVLIYR